MRSQVQVLAGPPPIVAGQSAAGTEPGALAASLGRAGAARPSPPAPPVAPAGPPTRASGSATTTHRGRAPSRGRQLRGGCRHLVLPPAPVPTAQPPARGAPDAGLACLVAQWSSAAAAARTNPAARVRHRPSTDQRDLGSVARVPASWTVDRAVDGPAAPGASTRSCGHGRPATSTWSPPPPPEHGRRRTRPDGRLDTGRLDTARVDSGRVDSGRVDSSRPTAGPLDDHPRGPDTGRLDSRIPDAETGWADTACWTPATDAVACLLAGSATATTPDRSRPAGRCSGQTSSGRATQDRSAARTPRAPTPLRTGLATAATVSCRWYAAVQLAPWRTAVLG